MLASKLTQLSGIGVTAACNWLKPKEHVKNAFVLILFAFGCTIGKEKDEAHCEEIDFTYDSGRQITFSMMIDKSGTILPGDGRRDKKFYVGTLSLSQLMTLDSLVDHHPLKGYENRYTPDKEDQPSFQIMLKHNKQEISIYSYGAL